MRFQECCERMCFIFVIIFLAFGFVSSMSQNADTDAINMKSIIEEAISSTNILNARQGQSEGTEPKKDFLLQSMLMSKEFMVLSHHALHARSGVDKANEEKVMQELTQNVEDFSSGTHRADATKEQCLSSKDGGPAAFYGDRCKYDKWLSLRKPILDYYVQPGADQQFRDAVANLSVEFHLSHKRTELSKNDKSEEFHTFFQNFCVQCTSFPLLQCDEATQKCVCWEQYLYDSKASKPEDKCKTKIGGVCDDFSGAHCVENSYCNQDYECECLENGKPCEGNGSIQVNSFFILSMSIMISWTLGNIKM